ncbi:MAG TPA: site-2 protease family protein [Acidimicrobiia bacterium]|nr:site-2 protease family protein [Acidimicrobiia bacterium]
MHIDEQTIIYFGCLVVAVILHEISHGVVALCFGDRTAKDAGRLTLNPVAHVDPFGTLILPAMGAIVGLPVFGYAKPVPVNPGSLHKPRRDMVYVSIAGPATNLTLMAAAAFAARAAFENGPQVFTYDQLPLATRVLFSFAMVNLLLGVFNLLPIPPLDGSALLERMLPARWLPQWYKFRPYGLLLIVVLVFMTGALAKLLNPLQDRLFDWVFQ